MIELAGVTHRYEDVGGLRMHVAEAGAADAPPLLLLHGWPQHWWMWRKVIPDLSRTWRVLAPDLRGLGWTDAPDGPYDKQRLADDVLGLMDVLGIERAPVIGHDWGAVAAQLMTVSAPERVSAALILSVPQLFERGTDPRQAFGFAHMPILSAPGADRFVPQLASFLLRISGITGDEARAYVDVLREPARRRATVGYYRTFTTREAAGLLSSPRSRPALPMRFMGGAGDPVCRYAPGLELVKGAAHFLPEDQPDAVIAAARSLFA